MKPNVERGWPVGTWLGVACLGLLPVSPLSAQEAKLRDTLQGHTAAVVSLAFSPDGKTLASASYDGTLKLWDVTSGKGRSTRTVKHGLRPGWDRLFSTRTTKPSSCGM